MRPSLNATTQSLRLADRTQGRPSVKFKKDKFGERVLEHFDSDGDRLRVLRHLDGHLNTICVNFEATYVSRKKLRKFAKAILKETSK
jgi:hypothetical protein